MTEKTIKIDPSLFDTALGSVSRQTRRNKAHVDTPTPAEPASHTANNTRTKELRKELINRIKVARKKGGKKSTVAPTVGSLGDAMSFFQKASSKRRGGFKNRTRRNVPNRVPELVVATDPLASNPVVPVSLEVPPVLGSAQTTVSPKAILQPVPPSSGAEPEWGCLKGGKKPTFRTWKTQRTNRPAVVTKPSSTIMFPPTPTPGAPPTDAILERQSKLASARARARSLSRPRGFAAPKRQTRKRLIGVHGSSLYVAVPSPAERATANLDVARIKKTPIEEVKRHLIEKGLIKYGNNAPDDIMRKMFEDGQSAGGAAVVNSEQAVDNILQL